MSPSPFSQPQPHRMPMQDAKEDRYRHALLLQRGGNLGKYTRATDKPKWDAINSLSEFKKYSNKT